MKGIKVLDSLVASKIAAGEVIERPASVVKELLENSLDAGSTSITLRIEKGGRELIRVQDNGSGIRAGDLSLVILRHATSKIEEEEDLLKIETLGFRGEAMASIAAVSRLTITTRERGADSGVRLTVEGGGEALITPAGSSEGTIVVVEDLFFNTPVRLKFLRSPRTESGRVLHVFRALALVNPGVRFSLERETGQDLHLPASGPKERFISLLGREKNRELIPITSSHIEGFIGGPGEALSSPKALHTYLNGRPIRDRTIIRAISDGYGRLIERGQYPVALINLKILPSDVDVNIHPAKTEVRFRNPGAVYSLVRGAVNKALGGRATGVGAGPRPDYEREYRGAISRHMAGEAGPAYRPGGEPLPPVQEERAGLFDQRPGREIKNPEFLGLKVRGQVWDEFLLAESRDGGGVFYIIDQHGAEERGAYERIKRDFYRGGVKRQFLLMPERVESTAEEAEALSGAMEALDKLGFEITPFGSSPEGGETFIIKSVPHILPPRETARLIKTLAVEMASEGGSARVEERIDKALMTIACHSVIRGPRKLSTEEGEELLKNLARMDFAGYCPHGRPVVKRLTRKEVEAFFNR